MQLAGKVAVITGAASGLGEATARLFVAHGASVVLADVQEDKGRQLAQELGGAAAFVSCDVRDEAHVSAAVSEAVEKFGSLDVMINNAGVVGAMGRITSMEVEAFDRTMEINLRGVLLGIKHAGRAMAAAGTHGCIINVSSIAGVNPTFASAGYAASKAGVIALTKLAAAELAPSRIRVNCIAPGITATPMIACFAMGKPSASKAEVEEYVGGSSPLKGQTLVADDIANAALYLASDQGRAVNAHTLVVDLGMVAGVTGEIPVMSGMESAFLTHSGRLGVDGEAGTFGGLGGAALVTPHG